jgi:hypothetical protein
MRNRGAWWCVLGFATAVALVSCGLFWAPGVDHGLATAKGMPTSQLSRHEWFDLAVAVAAAALAVVAVVRLTLTRPSRVNAS